MVVGARTAQRDRVKLRRHHLVLPIQPQALQTAALQVMEALGQNLPRPIGATMCRTLITRVTSGRRSGKIKGEGAEPVRRLSITAVGAASS